MADIPIAWKKITRGLPRGKRYADDRIPAIDEILEVLKYPDRRIKPVLYTMISSGIRIGVWNTLGGYCDCECVPTKKIKYDVGDGSVLVEWFCDSCYLKRKDQLDKRLENMNFT